MKKQNKKTKKFDFLKEKNILHIQVFNLKNMKKQIIISIIILS